MDTNVIEKYHKAKAAAEVVLAAAGYTPDKMLWECWKGMGNPADKKILTDATGCTYTFTAAMNNLLVYDLIVSKNGGPNVNIHSFCDH
jgi:hypothetical protein